LKCFNPKCLLVCFSCFPICCGCPR
jgi:hypothetical protein